MTAVKVAAVHATPVLALDGNLPVQALIKRQENEGHPAAPNLLHQQVTAHP
jgi:hypothetical protein